MSVLTKTLSAVAALGLAAVAVAVTPGSAQAAVSISCQASGSTSFSPGVQAVPMNQQISYRGDSRTCADHSGSGIRSARITADLHDIELGCVASSGGTGSGSATIQWEPGGQSSEVDITVDSSVLATGQVSGTVTRGPFEGQRFTGEFETSLVRGAFDCSVGAFAGGVRRGNFTGRFTIG
ncbi:hypothetical protein HD597_005763 [Nonomuraea thailandensis]|uniref:Uncharacterized protein n=1 Tax=Nonomuraea thailandensis TaxID=1188745 RepID=A0A9X2GQ31_9ACTN|nr:hypothetical protein [Nonomuraea thailandensis]MCP2358743.1 hypothetical protein [Nonomuraea thailandensis]